jgi:hypothetical protein
MLVAALFAAATAGAQDAAPPPTEPDASPPIGPPVAPPSDDPGTAGTPPASVPPPEPPGACRPEPGKKKKKGKNQEPQGNDRGGRRGRYERGRAIGGDPWGEEHGGAELGPIALRAMLQARYAATFAAPSTNVRPDYVVKENYLAQQGDGWSLHRFFLRISGDPSELVGLKGILDFAKLAEDNAEDTVKQAYAILKPIPAASSSWPGCSNSPSRR